MICKNYSTSNIRKSAYTLAEILIVITIIGVIAALTIPGLTSDTNDSELYVKWRKAYADIANATTMCSSVYGDIDFTTHDSMRNAFEKVMQFTVKDMARNIFAPKYLWYKNTWGQGVDFSTFGNPSAILPNGSYLRFASYTTNGGPSGGTPGSPLCSAQFGTLTGVCGYIDIDVNGKKGPNMLGKDFHEVWVVKKGGKYLAFPIGTNGDIYSGCIANSGGWTTSNGCSVRALYSGNLP